MLESEIKEYLDFTGVNVTTEKMASSIAEIAGNDCVDKIGDMIKTMEDCVDKIGDMIKIMEDYDVKIRRLEEENKELHAKLTANRFIFRTSVRNEYLDKIEELEQQLSSQLKLNRQEVDTILTDMYNYYFAEGDGYKSKIKMTVDKAITAICNLAMPVIDKDKIVEVLNKYGMSKIYLSNYASMNNPEFKTIDVADEIIKELGGK